MFITSCNKVSLNNNNYTGCVDKKFGKGTMAAHRKDIHRKVNQKYIDTYNKKQKIKNDEWMVQTKKTLKQVLSDYVTQRE